MRRNVRRLNREIGNHGSALPVSTQVSLPFTLPTSYQPRSQEAKIINEMKTVVGQEPNQPFPAYAAPIQPSSPISTSSVSDSLSAQKNSGNDRKRYSPLHSSPLPSSSTSASKKSNDVRSSGKKKSVRKAVNLSELQRYFHAAEEAAREIMLEEAIKAQYSTENNAEKDGVFQLTTLSNLPLKSPKRLIALQLANNNPAFRERFKQKLEQSGGPLALGKAGHANAASYTSLPAQYASHLTAGWSQGGFSENNESTFSFEGELEKFIHTPDWMRTHDNTLFNTGLTARGFSDINTSSTALSSSNLSSLSNGLQPMAGLKSEAMGTRSAKKELGGNGNRGGKRTKGKDANDTDDNDESSNKPIKLRQKRRKEGDYEGSSDDRHSDFASTSTSNLNNDYAVHAQAHGSVGPNDSSIIKRRRKGELQIMVDSGLTMGTVNTAGPLTNAIRANNLHSLMGGGIGDMGPPGETPRRSARLKNGGGALSTLSNLGTLNYLDSPFMEKSLLFSDGFAPFGVDTPSRLMHLDPPLSKSATAAEGVRFDFDEAVAAHFPSPRTGDHIKGNSPYRWSGGSAGSGVSGFFNFPDSTVGGQKPNSSLEAAMNAPLSTVPSSSNQNLQETNDQANIYAKKFKKALKKDAKFDNSDGDTAKQNEAESSSDRKDNRNVFQSPTQPTTNGNSSSHGPPKESRPRANSKVRLSVLR